MPLLTTFLDRVSRLRSVDVTISVHYTRAISHTLTEIVQSTQLPSNMHLYPGRPRLGAMLDEFADETKGLAISNKELSGLVVGMCGPLGLRDSVEEAQRCLSGEKRNSIGGVEVVIEYVNLRCSFNWSHQTDISALVIRAFGW